MRRLLEEANRHGNDPELFAGLVHACRYAGLFEQSIAAHQEARRLDPNIPTSYEQTVLMTCDLEHLLSVERASTNPNGDEVIRVIGLGLAGRREEAREALRAMRDGSLIDAFRSWTDFLFAWLDRNPREMLTIRATLTNFTIMDDPEAVFQEGWMFSDAGDLGRGLELLRHAVSKGYFVLQTLTEAPAFKGLRGDPAFQELVARARTGRQESMSAFREAGGVRLLGF